MKKQREITTTELFDAMGTFSEEMMRQFTNIRSEMATKKDIAAVRSEMATKKELAAIRTEMATKRDLAAVRTEMATKKELAAVRAEMATKKELATVRAEMVTKEDLKNATVHGDLRLNTLIGRLVEEKTLAPAKVADILRFRPAGT